MRYKQIAAPVILVSLPCIIFEGLLPLYTEQLNFTTFEMTLLFSVYALSGLIMRLIIGSMSDRFSRRMLLLLSLSAYGTAYLVLAGAVTMPQLMAARFTCFCPLLCMALAEKQDWLKGRMLKTGPAKDKTSVGPVHMIPGKKGALLMIGLV